MSIAFKTSRKLVPEVVNAKVLHIKVIQHGYENFPDIDFSVEEKKDVDYILRLRHVTAGENRPAIVVIDVNLSKLGKSPDEVLNIVKEVYYHLYNDYASAFDNFYELLKKLDLTTRNIKFIKFNWIEKPKMLDMEVKVY